MKTGSDTKWRHYDQDVVKSHSSYICHTPDRKNTQTNTIPPFQQNHPYPSAIFHPPNLPAWIKRYM